MRDMTAILEWLVVAAAVVFGASLVRLMTLVFPEERAVRARNALLLRYGRGTRFDWTPDDVPADFRLGDRSLPPVIERALLASDLRTIGGGSERALAITGWLMRNVSDGGGIRADLATTWRGIERGLGYCADFVRLFMVIAAYLDLFCRRWDFSFDGYGGHGHTVVEVYDRDRARWMFIDVYNNVYAVREPSDRPLGAMELRAELLRDPSNIRFVRASSARVGYPHHEKLVEYYVRGAGEWCLWWGNDEARRERAWLARVLLLISGKLAYRLVTGMLTAPPLVVADSGHDRVALNRMAALRRQLTYAAGVAAAAAVILIAALLVMTIIDHRTIFDVRPEPTRAASLEFNT